MDLGLARRSAPPRPSRARGVAINVNAAQNACRASQLRSHARSEAPSAIPVASRLHSHSGWGPRSPPLVDPTRARGALRHLFEPPGRRGDRSGGRFGRGHRASGRVGNLSWRQSAVETQKCRRGSSKLDVEFLDLVGLVCRPPVPIETARESDDPGRADGKAVIKRLSGACRNTDQPLVRIESQRKSCQLIRCLTGAHTRSGSCAC